LLPLKEESSSMKLIAVRIGSALAVVTLISGLAVTALPAAVAATGADAAATTEASIDYDHTYYTDHPQKCEDVRREYARWAWVSDCYRFGLYTWAFDYTCRIC
jgi:hypothetical protein